jgi:small subunit ribosomal protein S4
VIYRAGWANSHPQARQWLTHGQISFNGRKVTIPSILAKAGDKLELTGKSSKLKEIIGAYTAANKPASWLKVDSGKFTIEVKDLPNRAEIDLPVNESLIIEFYSR